MKIETLLTQVGRMGTKKLNTVNSPISQTTTSVFEKYEDFLNADTIDSNFSLIDQNTTIYGREGSNITYQLANAISQLEGADQTIITSCGGSALTVALTSFISNGDHIITTGNSYAVTKNLTSKFLNKFGVENTTVSPRIGKDIEKFVKPNTRVIMFESPSSKTFEIQEIDEIVEIAKKHNIITIFDNTWGGALCFQPLKFGIDVSLQSCSKYMNGCSDIFAGSVSVKQKHFAKLYEGSRYINASPSHQSCYMILRDMRSMAVRMKQHWENGEIVAKWLQEQKIVSEVFYPSLNSSPDYEKWKKYFSKGTGLMSFVLNKEYSIAQISNFVDSLKYFDLGYSWGGYNSTMTIGDLESNFLQSKYGKNTFMRIHVGLDNPQDLIDDLNFAFSNIVK